MERKKRIQKAVISGSAFVVLLLLCITCIWGVLAAAINGVATGGLATKGAATGGTATGSIASGAAAEAVATGGTATFGNAEEGAQNPVSITYLIENNVEISEEDVLNSIEYADGRLDYLDEESASYASQSIKNIVMEYVSAAESDAVLRTQQAGYYSVSLVSTTESKYVLATNNYDQNAFNDGYNKAFGTSYTGTCSETASAGVIEYYYRKGYGGTLGNTNRQAIFNKVLIEAIKCGGYPADEDEGGTYISKLKTAITGYYDYYKVDLDGNYDTLLLRSKIQSSINNAKPVVGHFLAPNGEGHAMCINGYYDITVKYKKKSTDTTYTSVTYRYYRVNDGWHYAPSSDSSKTDERLQYIREEYLRAITRIV